MREANEYKCTVHTLSIKPKMTEKWVGNEKDWIKEISPKQYPFFSINKGRRYDDPRVKINPHKLYSQGEGKDRKFIFDYRKLDVIEADLARIVEIADIEGYDLKRVDICFDCDKPFEKNEKIIRLIQLMISLDWNEDNLNLYTSYDPLTLEMKSTTCNNSKAYKQTVSTEHYNREIMNQEKWINVPIQNRFELRLMRQGLRNINTIEGAAEKWLETLDSLNRKRMDEVTEILTAAVYERWVIYANALGSSDIKNSKRNCFYSCQARDIFTREQVVRLYEMDGEADAVNNLLRSDRLGKLFELFTFNEVKAEIQALRRALLDFMGKSSKKTKSGKK